MKTSALLALLILVVVPLHAVNFTFNAAQNSGFATSDGIDLPIGSFLRFGVFGLSDAQIAENAGNFAYLDAHFTQLTTAVIGLGNPVGGAGDNDPINAGLFSRSLTDINTTSTGFDVAGGLLVYWVFDAPSAETATQHGIFSSTTWLIPPGIGDSFDFGVVYTDIADLTMDGAGQVLAGTARVLIGGFGPGLNEAGGGLDFTLATIPEPSAYAWITGLAGVLAVLSTRPVRRGSGKIS